MFQKSADWIQQKKNSPLASRMGGVWERQIQSNQKNTLISHEDTQIKFG